MYPDLSDYIKKLLKNDIFMAIENYLKQLRCILPCKIEVVIPTNQIGFYMGYWVNVYEVIWTFNQPSRR